MEKQVLTVEQRLSNIETLLLSQKVVLNFDELAAYTGLSKSYLYKCTSNSTIPHFKPQGKHIYFNKADIDQWLQRNPVKPLNDAELDEQAETYVTLRNMGAKA